MLVGNEWIVKFWIVVVKGGCFMCVLGIIMWFMVWRVGSGYEVGFGICSFFVEG